MERLSRDENGPKRSAWRLRFRWTKNYSNRRSWIFCRVLPRAMGEVLIRLGMEGINGDDGWRRDMMMVVVIGRVDEFAAWLLLISELSWKRNDWKIISFFFERKIFFFFSVMYDVMSAGFSWLDLILAFARSHLTPEWSDVCYDSIGDLESFQNVGIVMQYLLMPVRHVDTKEFIHTISRSPIPAKNKHHASTIIVPTCSNPCR